jgi:hypothetical protein
MMNQVLRPSVYRVYTKNYELTAIPTAIGYGNNHATSRYKYIIVGKCTVLKGKNRMLLSMIIQAMKPSVYKVYTRDYELIAIFGFENDIYGFITVRKCGKSKYCYKQQN